MLTEAGETMLRKRAEQLRSPAHKVVDGEPCRFCGKPIFWDDYCFIHANGWADCGIEMTPTHDLPWVPTDEDIERLGEEMAAALSSNERILINPIITETRTNRRHVASPRLYSKGWR